MKQIFVVYETDAWHSTSHRERAGVFTSKWAADVRCGARYAVYVVEQPGEFGTRCTDYLP